MTAPCSFALAGGTQKIPPYPPVAVALLAKGEERSDGRLRRAKSEERRAKDDGKAAQGAGRQAAGPRPGKVGAT
jgi:hypothetical protein